MMGDTQRYTYLNKFDYFACSKFFQRPSTFVVVVVVVGHEREVSDVHMYIYIVLDDTSRIDRKIHVGRETFDGVLHSIECSVDE